MCSWLEYHCSLLFPKTLARSPQQCVSAAVLGSLSRGRRCDILHYDLGHNATLICIKHGVKVWALAHSKQKLNHTATTTIVYEQFSMFDVQYMGKWESLVIQTGPGHLMYVFSLAIVCTYNHSSVIASRHQINSIVSTPL